MKTLRTIVLALLLWPVTTLAGNTPTTLLELAGVTAAPARLSESVLIIVDAQREYMDGALPLQAIEPALLEASRLLARARKAGAPVVHVVHRGSGRLFNPEGPYFTIAPPLVPRDGETLIEKRLPNAFSGTGLQKVIAASGRKKLLVVGFMTHMCVESTVRAALDLGYGATVVASATASRDLPDGRGGIIPAELVQRASLAALADRFATVVENVDAIPD